MFSLFTKHFILIHQRNVCINGHRGECFLCVMGQCLQKILFWSIVKMVVLAVIKWNGIFLKVMVQWSEWKAPHQEGQITWVRQNSSPQLRVRQFSMKDYVTFTKSYANQVILQMQKTEAGDYVPMSFNQKPFLSMKYLRFW